MLVEQNIHQTLDVADFGYVLAQGGVVTSGTARELTRDSELRRAYFGVH